MARYRGVAPTKIASSSLRSALSLSRSNVSNSDRSKTNDNQDLASSEDDRRLFLTKACLAAASCGVFGFFNPIEAAVAEEEDGFAAIAARASKLSGEVGEATRLIEKSDDGRTVFDFSLPISGDNRSFKDIVRQSYGDDGTAKVKAILVVNMKEDDPIARKDIPEFISLAAK